MESPGAVAQWRDYRRLWVYLRPTRRLVLVLVVSLVAGTQSGPAHL
jgi:hypothetical protein